MGRRIVVIGGGAAGMSAASAARRTDPSCTVVVVEASDDAAWGRCGLPYHLSREVEDLESLRALQPSAIRERRGIDLRLATRATRFDADEHTVLLEHDGQEQRLEYDRLVVAAGSTSVHPRFAAGDDPRVRTLREFADARAIDHLVDTGRLRRVLVVGAGFIGLEVAEACVHRGVEVALVEATEQVLPGLDAPMAARLAETLTARVDLRLGTRLTELVPHPDHLEVRLDHGSIDPVDAAVLAIGVRPVATLALEAGAAPGPGGALLVDDRQRTNLPDVLAAGDCVAARHRITGAPAFVPLALAANRMGRVAGTVAAGGDAVFPGVVGTAVVRVFEQFVARTGLSLAEATRAGLPAVATDIVHRSRAGYVTGSEPVHVRLVHEQAGGRLLGGALLSVDQAAVARIDVIAAALHAGFGLEDLAELDLAYAPPFGPVRSPVLLAAETALTARDAPARAGGEQPAAVAR